MSCGQQRNSTWSATWQGLEEEDHAETELQRLTLRALDRDNPATTWTRACTNGFAENVVRKGGSGVHVMFPDDSTVLKSILTDVPSTGLKTQTN